MSPDLAELSRAALVARGARVWLGRTARLVGWAARPASYPPPLLGSAADFPHLLDRQAIPIAGPAGLTDPLLEAGKRRNLALAAPHLDGLVLAPDRPLSFWRAVPRPTAARGYQLGAELRGGCVVPTRGGGLCLLSNALFDAAGRLGWRILERHAHTMQSAPAAMCRSAAAAPRGRLDATVLWPHVDLRVAPRLGRARLEVRVDAAAGALVVAIHGEAPATHAVELAAARALERIESTEAGRVRTHAVRRVVRSETGALLEDTFIALDRVRLTEPDAARRNCLTCERRCHARPRELAPERRR